jgi:hypothetical protein
MKKLSSNEERARQIRHLQALLEMKPEPEPALEYPPGTKVEISDTPVSRADRREQRSKTPWKGWIK